MLAALSEGYISILLQVIRRVFIKSRCFFHEKQSNSIHPVFKSFVKLILSKKNNNNKKIEEQVRRHTLLCHSLDKHCET